jgi:hypothetical protein
MTHIPDTGPWEGPPSCIMTTTEQTDADGKRWVMIRFRHSDGFVCLRFLDDDDLKSDNAASAGMEPHQSICGKKAS